MSVLTSTVQNKTAPCIPTSGTAQIKLTELYWGKQTQQKQS